MPAQIMRNGKRTSVIIPALNEEAAIAAVINAIPSWVDEIIVADNGSTDRTAEVALACGARVVAAPRKGYGSACQAGIKAASNADILAFIDGDFSDDPSELPRLVDPIARDEADLVIGSRTLGDAEPGALSFQQRWGNWLACSLIRLLWQKSYTDLGPFRAIRRDMLERLGMCDPGYGWTVEMQLKAVWAGLRVREIPVPYRRRIGRSKISGTVRGVVGAGTKILATVLAPALPTAFERMFCPRMHEKLIIFTRYPEPGRTKTRMIPLLGQEGAAELQREMTEHVLETCKRASLQRGLVMEVRHEGGTPHAVREWLGHDLEIAAQGQGDLGERMVKAFSDAFSRGASKVVIIGADCPGITPGIINRAFCELKEREAVFGPAHDGGYYLVGLSRERPELFQGISWGSAQVMAQTERAARNTGISMAMLDHLDDVDRPDDIAVWDAARRSIDRSPTISVIIPALNEAEEVARAVTSALYAGDVEVIVVDGGSKDVTRDVAQQAGARVLASAPGRARQMNTGAAAGHVLLFLHADTRLPPGYDLEIRRILADPPAVGGAFRLKLDSSATLLRAVAFLSSIRSSLLGIHYGDQGIFVRSEVFREVGGIPEIPILEDFEFIRRLRRQGRVRLGNLHAITSPRRWESLGVIKTTWTNQLIVISYFLGVPLKNLPAIYTRQLRDSDHTDV